MDNHSSRQRNSPVLTIGKWLLVILMLVAATLVRFKGMPILLYILLTIFGVVVITTGYQVPIYTTAIVLGYFVHRRTGEWPMTATETSALALPGILLAIPFWLCELDMGLMGRYKCGLLGSMFGDPCLLGIACTITLMMRIGVQLRWPRWRRRAIAIMFLVDVMSAVAIFLFVPPSPE